MKAFLLMAGRGERLRPLTDKMPKPLIKVGGRPIVWYIENLLRKHGVTDICVNLHYKPKQIIDYFGDRVLYSFEPELLGTAGALTKVRGWLGSPFLVLNGDTISDVDLTEMLAYHYENNSFATIFTHDTAIHNGGAFIFDKVVFDYIPENKSYSIHEDLLPVLIKEVKTALYKSNANYFDLGTAEKLERARKFFNNEKTACLS